MNVSIFKRLDRDSWRCQWTESTGRRRVRDFKSEAEARVFSRSLKNEMRRFGVDLADVDLRARMFLRGVQDIMDEQGLSYADVETLLRVAVGGSKRDLGEKIALRDAIDAFYRVCAKRGLRSKTMDHYERMLEAFARGRERTVVSDISAECVVSYISNRYANPESRNTCRTPIRAFFNWCVELGYVQGGCLIRFLGGSRCVMSKRPLGCPLFVCRVTF